MKIKELFHIETARSRGIEDYDNGPIPFVSNTETGNGIVRYVDPFPEDKVFDGPSVCISGLGFATLQISSYLPKGNGGDSCTILIPKKAMTLEELMQVAAIFNLAHKWRFSFGRKASKKRIEELDLALPDNLFCDYPLLSEQMHAKINEFAGQIARG